MESAAHFTHDLHHHNSISDPTQLLLVQLRSMRLLLLLDRSHRSQDKAFDSRLIVKTCEPDTLAQPAPCVPLILLSTCWCWAQNGGYGTKPARALTLKQIMYIISCRFTRIPCSRYVAYSHLHFDGGGGGDGPSFIPYCPTIQSRKEKLDTARTE